MSAIQAQKKFGLAIYKRSWYLFMIVSILMVAGSAIRMYISVYDYYAILWMPSFFDFIERAPFNSWYMPTKSNMLQLFRNDCIDHALGKKVSWELDKGKRECRVNF